MAKSIGFDEWMAELEKHRPYTKKHVWTADEDKFLISAKKRGFSDRVVAKIMKMGESLVGARRRKLHVEGKL